MLLNANIKSLNDFLMRSIYYYHSLSIGGFLQQSNYAQKHVGAFHPKIESNANYISSHMHTHGESFSTEKIGSMARKHEKLQPSYTWLDKYIYKIQRLFSSRFSLSTNPLTFGELSYYAEHRRASTPHVL